MPFYEALSQGKDLFYIHPLWQNIQGRVRDKLLEKFMEDNQNSFLLPKKLIVLLLLLWTLIVSGGFIYHQIVVNYQVICSYQFFNLCF
jgi:hypothetical protein